jgi:hypothetical protein
MPRPSEHLPSFIEGKSKTDLRNKLARVQAALTGRVKIITILLEGKKWVCWYMPPNNDGGGQY